MGKSLPAPRTAITTLSTPLNQSDESWLKVRGLISKQASFIPGALADASGCHSQYGKTAYQVRNLRVKTFELR